MRLAILSVSIFGSAIIAVSASAASPESIWGKWIQTFPKGGGMVTEFTQTSISSYPVDSAGKPLKTASTQNVTYRDLGQNIVGIDFSGGGGIMALKSGVDTLTMDFPGLAAFTIVKLKPNRPQ